jgi:predicted esterase
VIRAARFLRAYLRPERIRWREEEIVIPVGGQPREATLFMPEHVRRPVPGWVVLHGLTVPGRHHAAMVRFVRSLAASGAAVIVPDVPAWRELRIDTAAARETIADAARYLAAQPNVQRGRIALTGFSFGATQALVAAADPSLHGILGSVVGFGGYADLGRMMRAMMTGEHEWKGVHERIDPDPYGRWCVFGNYLTLIPGYEEMEAVRRGAIELAYDAGVRGTMSWLPEYDPLKAEIRARLSPREAAVWDVVAPPAGQLPADTALAEELSRGLTAAALRFDPALDPTPAFAGLQTPVILSHGVEDRLIPYTESLRLHEILSPVTPTRLTLTRLFSHSTHEGGGPVHYAREGWKFIRLLHSALTSV